uniref:Uncharacterized protein n=1 Tax=Klebsiella pneumoniae TaxID=573 RepID=A0A5P1PLM8_KLEPN|nr:hypothetical protein [Klebsiella pneumoniae]
MVTTPGAGKNLDTVRSSFFRHYQRWLWGGEKFVHTIRAHLTALYSAYRHWLSPDESPNDFYQNH